jgi:hypothetical protein
MVSETETDHVIENGNAYTTRRYKNVRKVSVLIWWREEKVRERNVHLEAVAECEIEIRGLEAEIERRY